MVDRSEKKIECIIPVLPVKNLQESIAFYTEKLGFKVDWGGEEEGIQTCQVSRDGRRIMLDEVPESPGVWVWIGLKDDELFSVYKETGVKVHQEPKNYSWAYEMKFEDPDGHVLWLGTESRKDIPLEDDG